MTIPTAGGHLWQELLVGDSVPGPIEIRQVEQQLLAGTIATLQEGAAMSLDSCRFYATTPWSQGIRVTVLARPPSEHALPPSAAHELLDLGFSDYSKPCSTLWPQATEQTRVHPVEVKTSERPAPCISQQPTCPNSAERKLPTQARAQQTKVCRGLELVKRVLLITLYHSTMTAFLENGWEPMRLRPLELLRDNYDDALFRLKNSEYQAMWIDLAEPRQFSGHSRMPQVCARLAILVQWAERKEVPVIFSACRRIAWQHAAIESLLQSRYFHVSYQNWCAYGVKVAPGVAASAVKHKMLSTIPLPSAECACPRGLEHTHDLDINRGPGSARIRASAEHQVLSKVVATLGKLTAVEPSESVKSPDPLCESVNHGASVPMYACECCGLLQATEFCAVCLEPCVVQPVRADEATGEHTASLEQQQSPVAEPGGVGAEDRLSQQESFPTEHKLRAQERRKQGLPTTARKKTKVVQQHFDDCGDSLASLDESSLHPKQPTYLNACFSDEDDDDVFEDAVAALLTPQLNALERQSIGNDVVSGVYTAIAVDVEEMLSLLGDSHYASWGPEIVELCGGDANSSKACVRRRLKAGHNFDIACGVDLTHKPSQLKVLTYIRTAKPLVVVMAPVCLPYGPLGTQNRTMYPETWLQSDAHYAPLAQFCGEEAQVQAAEHRYFLCEQPFPSTLFEIPPWPTIRAMPECCRIVFHQCQLGLCVQGQPAKKPTEFTANATQLLIPFANLQCPGNHLHVQLAGQLAKQAQVWPPEMCRRVAVGIDMLARHLANVKPWRLDTCLGKLQSGFLSSFPSVSTSTDGPGAESNEAADGNEPWRKCKGCLWRLEKHDPMHSRVPGICKHPNVEPMTFNCPACKSRKHRSDPGHTFGPDCRHVLTQERRSTRRRPYARRPAVQEPTADLHPSSLDQGTQQRAEEVDTANVLPPNGAEGGIPAPSESSSSSRAPRGPDQGPRHTRTRQEASAQTPVPADWSSFDVQASFRALRQADVAVRQRILRKLHLRWFHISADKMQKLLRTAGIDKETLDLIPAIVDTCRVCQHWSRPGTETKTSGRMVLGFNLEVEGDLMFCRINGVQRIVLVLVDRGVRWTATRVIESKSTPSLLDALDQSWIAVFGPMGVLVFDGETGLNDEEATTYFQLRGIEKRTAAPNQHTRIADRKIAVLRDTVHKLNTQLVNDGVNIPFVRLVAEATFSLNALTSINGLSPYTAVLGRVPAMLPCDETLLSDRNASDASRHSFRLRELAVQAIAEGTARERMKRAMNAQTKASYADLDYRVGEIVDYWREPVNKDTSGWRGPATITDLTRLEHGRIGIRTNTDQMLTCRVQDIRRSLTFLTESLHAFFGHPDELHSPSPSANQAQQVVQAFADSLTPGSVITLGFVKTADGQWVTTPHTESHRSVFDAAVFVAETVFQMTHIACIRVARAVKVLTQREEFSSSMLLWWLEHGSRKISFVHSEAVKLMLPTVIGTQWADARMVQLLSLPDEEGWIAARRVSSQPTAEQAQVESVVDRLSTIPEATDESSTTAVSWRLLCETFGNDIAQHDRESLTEAFIAIHNEEGPAVMHPSTVPELRNWVALAAESNAEIPAWKDACQYEEPQLFLNTEFCGSLRQCDCSPEEYTVLDSDEIGAYVALEIYGHMCKCLEELPRLPMADEHVELRFYEAHTRKAVIERTDDVLTPEEIQEHATAITQAIMDELKIWQGFNCFKRRDRAQAPCVIDVRWVFKWKIIKGERKIRARLCLRGFKETGADDQSNYAATATRVSQRIVVSECVLRGWTLASSDVPKAFLQGVSYDELAEATNKPKRDVSFELSGEALHCLRQLPQFKGFDARREVLHCLKPGTGCRDAPKCFSLKLRKATSEYGFVCSSVDQELELLFKDGSLVMMVLKHVDDLKMAGPRSEIEKFVEFLSGVFGKLDIDFHKFTFCGVQHEQLEDGSISLDQTKFLAACKPMSVPSKAPTEVLPEDVRRHFLSLLMTIAYALLTRPDLSVFVSALQRESHRAQYVHVKRINTLLRWAQANPRKIKYPVMSYPDALLQISDSSYRAKAEDGLSVRGMVSVRTNLKDIEAGCARTECHVIDFVSKAQRHVTRSTFSSELFAATDAVDVGLLYTVILHELKHGVLSSLEAKQLIEGEKPCAVLLCVAIDAKSVSAAIIAPNLKVPAEPSLLLHVCWMRSLLACKRLHRLYWCDTRAMVADAMTKGAVTRELITLAMQGTLEMTVPYEAQMLT